MTFLLVAVFSIAAHEAGHVLAGLSCGWKFRGVVVKWRYGGIAVAMEGDGNQDEVWKFAAGGLMVSAFLALASIRFLPGELGMSLLVVNVLILAVNLIPLEVSDGGKLVRGLRGRNG